MVFDPWNFLDNDDLPWAPNAQSRAYWALGWAPNALMPRGSALTPAGYRLDGEIDTDRHVI
jgi:hypothetical protein